MRPTYYYLCKSLETGGAGGAALEVHREAPIHGQSMQLLRSARLKKTAAKIELKIVAVGGSYSFYYAEKAGQWKMLMDKIDGTFLSTRVAGGFVGSLFGLYATSSGAASTGSAHFDWFEYEGDDRRR